MGTKFANMHILSDELEGIKESLKRWYSRVDNNRKNVLKNIGVLSLLEGLTDNSCGKCYLGNFKSGWISILHPDFNWESVNDVALEISKKVIGPILTIGYFDDDIFILTVIKAGYIITRHIAGYSLDAYGLQQNEGDAEVIVKELDFDVEIDELKIVLNQEDIEKKVIELEKLLKLPLWINADWIDEMEESDKFKTKWQVFKLQ
jgi:hypothetical protein